MSLRSVLALPALVLGLLVAAAVVAPRAAYAQPESIWPNWPSGNALPVTFTIFLATHSRSSS